MPTRNRRRPVYYWDTCIFIRWIAGRQKGPAIYDAIAAVVREIRENRALMFTSSVTRTELAKTQMRPADALIYDDIMKRRNVTEQNYETAVADLASAVQADLMKRGKTLGLGDLMHLATAIFGNADQLHTTDTTLQSCDGDQVIGRMRIVAPTLEQTRLF